jgi:hypothetical protein
MMEVSSPQAVKPARAFRARSRAGASSSPKRIAEVPPPCACALTRVRAGGRTSAASLSMSGGRRT